MWEQRMKREVSIDPWAEFVDWFIGKLRNVPLTYPVPIVTLGELYEKARELGITATADELAERLERERLARKVPRRGYVIPLWLEEDEKCDTLKCLQAVRQALAVAVLADRAEGRDRERYLQAVAQFCRTYRWPMPEPLDRSIIYLYQKYGDGLTWVDLIDRHSFCSWVKSLGFGAAGEEIIKEAEEILREAEELRVQPYLNMIRAGYAQLKAAVEHGELEQAREILNTMRGHLERARKYRKGGYGALTDAEKRGLMSGAVMVIDRVADDLVGRIQRILLARGERPRIMKEKDKSKYPDEYALRIHSPIADITLRARIVKEREGGAVEYSMEGIVEEGEYGCRETISFSTTDRREFEERAGNELVRAWERVQECAAVRGSAAREISKEFEELDREGERVHKVAFRALGRAKNAVETIEGKLKGEVSAEELKEMERKIVRSLDEVHDASNKLVAFKEWVEKTAEDLKRKYPAEAEFIESLKDTILRKHNVEGLLSALGEWAGNLTRLLDEVRIEMRMEERLPKRPSEKPKEEGVVPTPPKPPEKKASEKSFFKLAEKLAFEKLMYFAKAKALELGFSLSEARKILDDIKDEILLLAEGIVMGDVKQEDAEREIAEGLRSMMLRKIEEEYKRPKPSALTEVREAEKWRSRFRREAKLLVEDVARTEGVDPDRLWDRLKDDVRTLEQEIVTEEDFNKALKALEDLARRTAKELKEFRRWEGTRLPVRGPEGLIMGRPRRYEYVPEYEGIDPKEAAIEIWENYLYDLLMFGLRYVLSKYGKKIAGGARAVAKELADILRRVGDELLEKYRRKGLVHYWFAGDFLKRYANRVVWEGLMRALQDYVDKNWVKFAQEGWGKKVAGTGVSGCIERALAAVILDHLRIPEEWWPENARWCLDIILG